MLKSDDITSAVNFEYIAPYLFTSELINAENETNDSLKDCMQVADEDDSGLSYQKSWIACQGTLIIYLKLSELEKAPPLFYETSSGEGVQLYFCS